MSDQLYTLMSDWLARAGGRARSSVRKDGESLRTAVDALRHMPGFRGVREQKRRLISRADLTREVHLELRLDDLGGYLDKRMAVFDGAHTVENLLGGALASATSEFTSRGNLLAPMHHHGLVGITEPSGTD